MSILSKVYEHRPWKTTSTRTVSFKGFTVVKSVDIMCNLVSESCEVLPMPLIFMQSNHADAATIGMPWRLGAAEKGFWSRPELCAKI